MHVYDWGSMAAASLVFVLCAAVLIFRKREPLAKEVKGRFFWLSGWLLLSGYGFVQCAISPNGAPPHDQYIRFVTLLFLMAYFVSGITRHSSSAKTKAPRDTP
jgi:hypothetical protein